MEKVTLKEIADSAAFPSVSNSHFYPGMTLREYLASQAMHGFLSAGKWDASNVAAKAVHQADELIKALNSK
jgi:hypothetical protein